MKYPTLRSLHREKAVEKEGRLNNGDGGVHQEDGYDHSQLPRATWRVFVMAILVSMGGFIFGYDTGQISGFLGMPTFQERFGEYNHHTGEYYFSNVRTGLIVGLLSIGTLTGALVAAPLADIIGRRWSIFAWCIVFHVGNIVQIASSDNKWYQIMMGRWTLGLSVGSLSLLVPMYMAETAPYHIRGALISCYQLFITLGIFLAACINYGTQKNYNDTSQWRIPMGIGFLWPLILGVGILFFPDTPRYAFRKGRVEEAKQTMLKVYGVPDNHWSVYHELEEIRLKLESESSGHGFIRDYISMFSAPRMAYRIAIGMGLQMFQQLTGANYFFYYGTLIFNGVSINPFVTQLILNGINFGVTFIGLYLIEHYGRRKSLMAGSAWMFICFLIFASVGHFALDRDDPTNTPHASKALICFACFFILGFATTWGPMVWTIMSEIYPSQYRAKAMSLATASNWLWNFLLAFFTSFITGAIDFRYGYVFAGCNLLGGLIVFFFVVEGRGRTLEEIDTMYLDGVLAWESNKWEAPSLETMRNQSTAGYRSADAEAAIQTANTSTESEREGTEKRAED
ncbi:hypothetical protein LTR65_007834 [Meristemomyces frigidus]